MGDHKYAQILWTDFQNNISGFVGSIQESTTFSDVTLVGEDDSHIEANKVVLCAASFFFRRILTPMQHSHPLVYLRGLSKKDLQNIVNFIYHGEVKIDQENITSFMSVAEDLQIIGLLEAFVSEGEKSIVGQAVQPTNTYEIFREYEGDVQVNQQKSKEEQMSTQSIQGSQTENVFTNEFEEHEVRNETIYFSKNADNNLEKTTRLFKNENKRMTKKSLSINEYLRNRSEDKDYSSANLKGIATSKVPMFWDGSLKDGKNGRKYSRCYICGSRVNFEQNMLERHWKRYHSEASEDRVITVEEGENPHDVIELLIESRSIENGLKLFCKICGKIDNRADLKRHVDAYHLRGAIYGCKGCSNIFRLDQTLQRHVTHCVGVISHKAKPKAKKRSLFKNEEVFKCKVCGITLKNKHWLRKHVQTIHNFACSLCENQILYSSKKDLATHVIEIHS